MTKRRCITALVAATALIAPAAADAHPLVAHTPKPLSFKAAQRARLRIARTGHFPAAPRLRLSRDARAALPASDTPDAGFQAPGPATKLFGNEASYAVKRDQILTGIGQFYAAMIPRWGGTYTAPALFEVQDGGQFCGGPTYNGVFCWANDRRVIGWSVGWAQRAFATHGDMEWATLLAHEYGHLAADELGLRGGWMDKTLYSEGFADCAAGGFMWHAYKSGWTDSVGRGDGNEFRDFYSDLASPTTTVDNHGTFQWRYALGLYGWNYGFDGCVRWARSIMG